VASGDVEEFLSGLWALASQFMDQGLVGGSEQKCSDDVGVGDIEQLVALPGEASDVLTKSFS
jgi:hypothetical protein